MRETYDNVVFACNANQTLMLLDRPTFLEQYTLSSIRYESELHIHMVVHSDASVLPDSEVNALKTRSNHIEQYGARPDNYKLTYIMHNQQPWASRSDKPCLVTYNPVSQIDEEKVIGRWCFQDIVHNVCHVALLIHPFRFIQGKRRTWPCGLHTLMNSRDTCFVSGWLPRPRLAQTIHSTTPMQGVRTSTMGASRTVGDSGKPRAEVSQPAMAKRKRLSVMRTGWNPLLRHRPEARLPYPTPMRAAPLSGTCLILALAAKVYLVSMRQALVA